MKLFTKFVLILAGLAVLLNAAERFDSLVRSDFFAGMAGDKAAMNRAMKVCKGTIAKNPKHAGARGELLFGLAAGYDRLDPYGAKTTQCTGCQTR